MVQDTDSVFKWIIKKYINCTSWWKCSILLSYSGNPLPFTKPEDSLPCPQDSITQGPILSQINHVYNLPSYFFKIVCLTTCFGRRRASSGQDAQFLSRQLLTTVPPALTSAYIGWSRGVVYSFIILAVEN
jgi:hypothetical protein